MRLSPLAIVLIVVALLLIFGGGGRYYNGGLYAPYSYGIGTVLLVLFIIWLFFPL